MSDDRQILKLGARILENLPDIPSQAMQDWIDCPLALQEYLAGLSVSPLVVKVDRSVKPAYPDWVARDEAGNVQLIHPELECEGPAEFHLRTGLTQWLHDGQKNGGYTAGRTIYEHLKDNGMLSSCLNLQDGIAIQAKGIAVFRKLFQGKALPLWKSVVRGDDGYLGVPYLGVDGSQVVVIWDWLVFDFFDSYPALRFASN